VRFLDLQLPYRLHILSLRLGTTLDVGCGVGRHLQNLDRSSVGIDHNSHSVAVCREQGLTAYTSAEFDELRGARNAAFDTILFSHVLEHMPFQEAKLLVAKYAQLLKPEGQVVIITPQEAGFASDPTHVHFLDLLSHAEVLKHCKLGLNRQYSFPFPRFAGRFFKHNEFVSIAAGETLSIAIG
jgi:2-polyprenyl-3-methyl-5-hydroxy-6-metoxy-1,4-benzoquinol methylase